MMIDVTVKLPDALVEQAQAEGILTDERIAALITAELERKHRVREFFSDVEKLHAIQPPLKQEEIDDEIRAYREEKAAKRKA